MNKAIYIATSEQNSGKSIITLGLMSMLMGKMAKVGYFRPIIEDIEERGFDKHIETVIGHFGMDIEFEGAFAITKSKLIKKKNKGKIGETEANRNKGGMFGIANSNTSMNLFNKFLKIISIKNTSAISNLIKSTSEIEIKRLIC